MSTFVHRDLIAEKLEIARTLGLVTRYVVRPTEGALSVRVWRTPGTSESAVSDYLARLLSGLVSRQQIAVLPRADEVPPPERVDSIVPSIAAAA